MATEDACKLFVAGLPDSVTEDVLREIFEAVGGTVVDVSLPRDRATGRPRGFGFVTFSTADEASNARQSLDGSLQAGRSISVRPFSSEPPRRGETRGNEGASAGGGSTEDRTLYVGNLPYDASQQEVIAFLGEHGVTQIARVHLPAGPDGRPRGFGFVTLQTADAANQAIISLRGVEVRGRRLLVNIAHPRGAAPGGGAGGRGMGTRPPREDGGGGWSGGGGGGGYAAPPADAPPGSRPEGRRRGAGGPPEGGEEGDARRKKKKGSQGGAKGRGAPPERGGGGNWRSWNRDDDD
jgi:RNA recognition motif-containing protein